MMTNFTHIERSLERQHQDVLEAADVLDEQINSSIRRIEIDLRIRFLAQLSQGHGTVPILYESGREGSEDIGQCLMSTLDFVELNNDFMRLMRESECPMVIALKEKAAKKYAKMLAPELARVRYEA